MRGESSFQLLTPSLVPRPPQAFRRDEKPGDEATYSLLAYKPKASLTKVNY